MYQGLIIEGISGTGKTAVLESLMNHPYIKNIPAMSRMVLTEHHTQRTLELLEQRGLLEPSHHLSLMNDVITFIESLHQRTVSREWDHLDFQEQDFLFFLERFHLTHVFRFPHMSWDHVADIDHRLKQLGTILCLLTVSAETLEKRLFSRRNECWLNYLKRYGNTKTAVVDSFMNTQQIAVNLGELSNLPLIRLDTTDLSADDVADAVALKLGVAAATD